MADKLDLLLRDIETLHESIKLNGQDLASLVLDAKRREGILRHSAWCLQALDELNRRLEAFDAKRP